MEVIVIKDGKELKLGQDVNVNIRCIEFLLSNYFLRDFRDLAD